jgi:hypothetical protein
LPILNECKSPIHSLTCSERFSANQEITVNQYPRDKCCRGDNFRGGDYPPATARNDRSIIASPEALITKPFQRSDQESIMSRFKAYETACSPCGGHSAVVEYYASAHKGEYAMRKRIR